MKPIALIVACLALIALPARAHALPVVTAGSATVEVGDTFTIPISIADAVELQSWQFDLAFDPALLSATAVTEGPFLSQSGASSTLFISGVIDNTTGHITLVHISGARRRCVTADAVERLPRLDRRGRDRRSGHHPAPPGSTCAQRALLHEPRDRRLGDAAVATGPLTTHAQATVRFEDGHGRRVVRARRSGSGGSVMLHRPTTRTTQCRRGTGAGLPEVLAIVA